MKVLRRTQFGNPILRQVTQQLSPEAIQSKAIQTLIQDMYHTLQTKNYGVGLAAPQVGQGIALAIIDIKPTEARPKATPFSLTMINPTIVRTFGRRSQLWEGCISLGGSQDAIFAKVPRFKRIRVAYSDGEGEPHEADYDGLAAHVMQHEINHLNGTLFVDRVTDTTTYSSISEYKKRYRNPKE